ncbi:MULTISPECIES: hypothetical protein [unclassified Arenibacter]|uniref:hypothetical protein n=1 Tax=unclassified Arenibacter TaxID=2615047 RepID=UPI002042C94A|nr:MULTISPECIES: hypothetical protein [unclassified Arenibacter]
MKTKTYIAVFLTFIFLAKFAAIDANGLNLLFSGSDISFQNPHCKKEKLLKHTKQNVVFSQAALQASQVITLNGFCSTQFQLAPFSWEIVVLKSTTVFNEHLTSKLSYLYIDNDSPPPRLV